MAGRARAALWLNVGMVIGLLAAVAAAQAPQAVSPGETDRIVEIEGRCPIFSWSAVPGATAYELVVYRLPDPLTESDSGYVAFPPSDQVLYAVLPGGATAWQPGLADGLEPGVDHAWFVRAVLDQQAGAVVEASEWSAGRFFAVSRAPSPLEIRQALDVLRRAADGGGEGAAELDDPSTRTRDRDATRGEAPRQAIRRTGAAKAVPAAPAAVRGRVSEPSGESYGLVGVGASPDGAGVAAANSAGGPDLVLDGSEDLLADAELSESGIDRPWATPQTFDITNSAGAGMTLRVDGAEVLTEASELDADTLDGVAGAAYATETEAAAMVTAHAGSADHDDRYFTETELGTSGAGGAVHWDNLSGVPAGFADGVDDDTQYTTGHGVIIDGGEVRIDPAVFRIRWSVIDEARPTYVSMAFGSDDLPLISYCDTNNNLKVAHCEDIACESSTVTTIDSSSSVLEHPSLTIGGDGLGLISYSFDYGLRVAHCIDIACSAATIVTVNGESAAEKSITTGTDGLGLISYRAAGNDLRVARCNDSDCSSPAIVPIDTSGGAFQNSISIGADGLGLIAYGTTYVPPDYPALKVTHCENVACSSFSTFVVDTTDLFTHFILWPDIVVGGDGLGLIKYDNEAFGPRVAHCDNTECSTAVLSPVAEPGPITVGFDGLGFMSHREFQDGGYILKAARCRDADCSSSLAATLDHLSAGPRPFDIIVNGDGVGLVAYTDESVGYSLNVAYIPYGLP